MKKVLVIGKSAQLGSITMTRIVAALKQKKLISDSSEVEFQVLQNQKHFPRLTNQMEKPVVVLIGLKSSTITETVGNIDRNAHKNVKPTFMVVAWEGPQPTICPTVAKHVSFHAREEFGLVA